MAYNRVYRGSGRAAFPAAAGIGCLIVLVIAVVLFFLAMLAAPYYTTQLWWGARAGLFVILPLGIVAALGIGAGLALDVDRLIAATGLGLLAVVAFLGSIGFWVAHSYLESAAYVTDVKVVDAQMPAMSYRAPFTVAEAQANPDLGAINGDRKTTMYLPDRKEFTTLVGWRGSFRGYETLLVQHVSDTGRNTHDLCEFSPAADRQLGGLFSHSLGRLVNESARFVNWDEEDVYGYCDQGHPFVVVPLKAQSGVFVVTERPAGVAVYDGRTGQMQIITDPAQIAKIPGPTYPLSIAQDQRGSTDAISGFGDWWFNRAGYELPNDMQVINSANVSEYTMGTRAGDRPVFTTPLTGRGSATAIAAWSVVDATQSGTGRNTVTIHKTDPVWLSTASVEDRIHANLGDVFMLQPRATIQELAPVDGGHWVATIGLAQNMLYRVTGAGDLSTDACLLKLTGEQIRCGGAALAGGAGPGVAVGQLPGAASSPGVTPVPASSDLHGLSKPQLIDLIQRATAELGSR